MKVTVDQDKCQGHALCNMSLEAVFTLRDDGHAEVDESAVADDLAHPIRAAEAMCPEGAISVDWT